MACISRFATAILNGETELALGTIRAKQTGHKVKDISPYMFITFHQIS